MFVQDQIFQCRFQVSVAGQEQVSQEDNDFQNYMGAEMDDDQFDESINQEHTEAGTDNFPVNSKGMKIPRIERICSINLQYIVEFRYSVCE